MKPIALNLVAAIPRDPETRRSHIPGIGGITTWRDAAEVVALGASMTQVCTAAMTRGFKIVEDMPAGLSDWKERKGHADSWDFVGKEALKATGWKYLDLNCVMKARTGRDLCIKCGGCHAACEESRAK